MQTERSNIDLRLVTPDQLIDLLFNDEWRKKLLAALKEESGIEPCLEDQLSELLINCPATDEQIKQIIDFELLSTEANKERTFFHDIIFNAAISEQTLLEVIEKIDLNNIYITNIGHRNVPVSVLEAMAEKFQYPESLTTLALYHYGTDAYPLSTFVNFVKKHRAEPFIQYNITNIDERHPITAERREVASQILNKPQA